MLRAHQNMDLMAWRLAAKQRTSYIQNRVVKVGSWCQLWAFLIEKKNSHGHFFFLGRKISDFYGRRAQIISALVLSFSIF